MSTWVHGVVVMCSVRVQRLPVSNPGSTFLFLLNDKSKIFCNASLIVYTESDTILILLLHV